MQIPPITIEEAAEQFRKWRQTKITKFDPIPNSLKTLVKQLIPHYSSKQIVKQLKINTAIIKPFLQNKNLDPDINFIPFQINSKTNQNPAAINPKQYQSICQIMGDMTRGGQIRH